VQGGGGSVFFLKPVFGMLFSELIIEQTYKTYKKHQSVVLRWPGIDAGVEDEPHDRPGHPDPVRGEPFVPGGTRGVRNDSETQPPRTLGPRGGGGLYSRASEEKKKHGNYSGKSRKFEIWKK